MHIAIQFTYFAFAGDTGVVELLCTKRILFRSRPQIDEMIVIQPWPHDLPVEYSETYIDKVRHTVGGETADTVATGVAIQVNQVEIEIIAKALREAGWKVDQNTSSK